MKDCINSPSADASDFGKLFSQNPTYYGRK